MQSPLEEVFEALEEASYLQKTGPWPTGLRDVHAREPNREYTALHYAAMMGESFYTNTLIQAGADVNAVGRDGMSALLFSASLPSQIALRGFETFVKAGVNLFHVEHRQWGVLHFLAFQDNARALKDLVDRGLDLYGKTVDGRTPFRVALRKGSHEALETLMTLMGDTPEAQIEYQEALEEAVENFYIRYIALLMKKGASLRVESRDGKTLMDLFQAQLDRNERRRGFVNEVIEIEQLFLHDTLPSGTLKMAKRL